MTCILINVIQINAGFKSPLDSEYKQHNEQLNQQKKLYEPIYHHKDHLSWLSTYTSCGGGAEKQHYYSVNIC